MSPELELTIGFTVTGNALGYLGGGWARAEPEFTWAVGEESHLILQRSKAPGDSILTLDVIPFVHPPELPAQRLIVSINDTVVGSSLIYRPTLLAYRIPAHLMRRGERVLITLLHPDAARPTDFPGGIDQRTLAFSISEARLYRVAEDDPVNGADLPLGLMFSGGNNATAEEPTDEDLAQWVLGQTGLTLPQLAMQFESLGENCELGLVQRRCEAEPLGLLRFSSTFLRNLIRGLDRGFEGLGATDEIDPRLEGPGPLKEFMIHEKRYGLVYHTFVYDGQRSVWLMREQESARLKFLRRKFMEDLEAAEKIFVYKRNADVSEEEVLPLFLALRRYGPHQLLWVVPADATHPPGTVEITSHGILKGYIDRFAPDHNAHDFSFAGWMRLCVNAYQLSNLKKIGV